MAEGQRSYGNSTDVRGVSQRLLAAAGLVFFSIGLIGPLSDATAQDRCHANKLRAIAKKQGAKLACRARAAKDGTVLLVPLCDANADSQFWIAFAKAGGCSGDLGICENAAEDCIAKVSDLLPEAGPDRCAAEKLKASGKHARARALCYSKVAKTGDTTSVPLCVAKAKGQLFKAFAKADLRGPCAGLPDDVSSVIEEECVAQHLALDEVGGVLGLCPGGYLTTTTTTTSTTTTVTVPSPKTCFCEITFGVTNVETLGALQFDVYYADVGGGFDGTGGSVDCTRLAGDFAAFNDIEGVLTLSSAFISAAGVTGPVDVARCRYTRPGGIEPVPEDFPITITDQSKPDFTSANATVAVTNIGCICSGSETTTTSTTTTTGGTTTTTIGGGLFNVAFDLTDAVTAGALQFEVDYSGAGGNFTGTGASVACTSPLSAGGAFVSFNDVEGVLQLNFAAVAIAGFTGPTTIANCEFDTNADPADFLITVVDASAPDLTPIVPLPNVTVSAVTPK